MAKRLEKIDAVLARLAVLQRHGSEDASLRVMLLTSSLRSGHMMAARALEAALQEKNPGMEIETVDFWSLMDPEVADALCHAYLDTLAEEPQLFDDVYRLGQQAWQGLFDSGESLPGQLETLIDHLSARVMQSHGSLTPNGDRPSSGNRPSNGNRFSKGDRFSHGNRPSTRIRPYGAAGVAHPSDRVLLLYLHAALARRRQNTPAVRILMRRVLSRWIRARLMRRLEHRLDEFRPHAAIATQMGPAALLAGIRARRRLALPLIAVPTDFGIHDFWLQRGVNCFCIAHESVQRPDLPAESLLHVTGLPLMPGFRRPPERHGARVELGLDPERPVVLVAGGGLGIGVGELSERVLAEVPGVTVVAVNGRNASDRVTVRARAPFDSHRLIDCGWTDRMPALLRAADVVVGKPGGLTVAESLACGRYLLAINSPGGQEKFNVRFLARHGAGTLIRKEDVGERLRTLFADRGHFKGLQAHVASLGGRDGAVQIAALALDAARQGREALTEAYA